MFSCTILFRLLPSFFQSSHCSASEAKSPCESASCSSSGGINQNLYEHVCNSIQVQESICVGQFYLPEGETHSVVKAFLVFDWHGRVLVNFDHYDSHLLCYDSLWPEIFKKKLPSDCPQSVDSLMRTFFTRVILVNFDCSRHENFLKCQFLKNILHLSLGANSWHAAGNVLNKLFKQLVSFQFHTLDASSDSEYINTYRYFNKGKPFEQLQEIYLHYPSTRTTDGIFMTRNCFREHFKFVFLIGKQYLDTTKFLEGNSNAENWKLQLTQSLDGLVLSSGLPWQQNPACCQGMFDKVLSSELSFSYKAPGDYLWLFGFYGLLPDEEFFFDVESIRKKVISSMSTNLAIISKGKAIYLQIVIDNITYLQSVFTSIRSSNRLVGLKIIWDMEFLKFDPSIPEDLSFGALEFLQCPLFVLNRILCQTKCQFPILSSLTLAYSYKKSIYQFAKFINRFPNLKQLCFYGINGFPINCLTKYEMSFVFAKILEFNGISYGKFFTFLNGQYPELSNLRVSINPKSNCNPPKKSIRSHFSFYHQKSKLPLRSLFPELKEFEFEAEIIPERLINRIKSIHFKKLVFRVGEIDLKTIVHFSADHFVLSVKTLPLNLFATYLQLVKNNPEVKQLELNGTNFFAGFGWSSIYTSILFYRFVTGKTDSSIDFTATCLPVLLWQNDKNFQQLIGRGQFHAAKAFLYEKLSIDSDMTEAQTNLIWTISFQNTIQLTDHINWKLICHLIENIYEGTITIPIYFTLNYLSICLACLLEYNGIPFKKETLLNEFIYTTSNSNYQFMPIPSGMSKYHLILNYYWPNEQAQINIKDLDSLFIKYCRLTDGDKFRFFFVLCEGYYHEGGMRSFKFDKFIDFCQDEKRIIRLDQSTK